MVDRIKHDAPVLVIGLGRFGAATAGQLDRLGREVLAVDEDEALVQKWAERVTHAVVADGRSLEALKQIGAQEFSIAVCAVGSSIGPSGTTVRASVCTFREYLSLCRWAAPARAITAAWFSTPSTIS